MGPTDFFFLGTALLALTICLRRTRIAEETADHLRRELDRAEKTRQRTAPLVTLGLLSQPPEFTEVDPVELARAVHRDVAAYAYAHGVRVHAVFESVPTIVTGAQHLEKALEHLLLASVDSGAADVTLAVGQIDDCVLISVSDDAHEVCCIESAAALANAIGVEFVQSEDEGAGVRVSLRIWPAAAARPKGDPEGGPQGHIAAGETAGKNGAPDGNRTHISSLGSWRSTTELQARREAGE